MPHWICLAPLEDCPPGSASEHVAEGRVIALFRTTDEEVYALDGVCPHQGGPLGKGQLDGCVVTCPWHGWQLDVRTGQHIVSPSVRHRTMAVKIEDGAVFVDVES